MKKYLLFSAALLFGAALCAGPAPAQEPEGPSAHLDTYTLEMGEVTEGTVVESVFKVFNKGDQPLLIKNVRPG